MLLFRVIGAISAEAAALIAFLAVRKSDPTRALTAALLVAWCPFVVIECGLGAHNDSNT